MAGETKYDIALVVALPEEFRWLRDLLPMEPLPPVDDEFYYVADLGGYRVLIHQLGDMGMLMASLAITKLLSHFEIGVIVLVGIAGGVGHEVRVGDVIVAREIDHYLHAAKASRSDDDPGFKIDFSGMTFSTSYALFQLAANFEFISEESFTEWHDAAGAFLESNLDLSTGHDNLPCHRRPQVHIGPIASGEFVSAATDFTRYLRSRNRKYLAIEMEAGGVALAAHAHSSPSLLLVVRGVSDMADDGKTTMESGHHTWPNNFWRRYSLLNAVGWVCRVVTCEAFAAILPPSGSVPDAMDAPDPHDNLSTQLEPPKVYNELNPRLIGESSATNMDWRTKRLNAETVEAFETHVYNQLRAVPNQRLLEHNLIQGTSAALRIDQSLASHLLSGMIRKRLALRRPPYVILPSDLI